MRFPLFLQSVEACWMAAQPCGLSTTLPSSVPHANLPRVHSPQSSRSSMKILLHNISPSTDHWGPPLVTGPQLHFVLPLDLAIQPVFSLLHNPLTQPVLSHLLYEDVIAESVKGLTKLQVNIHCSPLSKLDTSLWKAVRSARKDFLFISPSWLLTITFLSFICLEMASRIICPSTFPVIEVRLTCLYFPDLPSYTSWREEWHSLPLSPQTSLSHHDLPETGRGGLTIVLVGYISIPSSTRDLCAPSLRKGSLTWLSSTTGVSSSLWSSTLASGIWDCWRFYQ